MFMISHFIRIANFINTCNFQVAFNRNNKWCLENNKKIVLLWQYSYITTENIIYRRQKRFQKGIDWKSFDLLL